LPSCQDTGTAIVVAKKGENVYTGVDDGEYYKEIPLMWLGKTDKELHIIIEEAKKEYSNTRI
jgi:hypothetical protein